MIQINLHNLLFFSYHGVHEEESIVGAEFKMDVTLGFNEQGKILSLQDSIDYVVVYNIIKEKMKHPSRLLETVVMEVAEEIKKLFPLMETININLSKLHPPINNFTGNVGVTYHKAYL